MPSREPKELNENQVAGRQGRVARLASRFGFTGTVEYRHAYSQSGGAQFCFGAGSASDLLLVYAEAFERDSDPDDFSLAAIIAHECGHQRLLRDSNLAVIGRKLSGQVFEEVLASLIGSLSLMSRAMPSTWLEKPLLI